MSTGKIVPFLPPYNVNLTVLKNWICRCLGFEKQTLIIYSDALGLDMDSRLQWIYQGAMFPFIQPDRSKDFATTIASLFYKLTDEIMITPIGSTYSHLLIKAYHSDSMCILGSEVSNRMFRMSFSDIRGGGFVDSFVAIDKSWQSENLPIKVTTETTAQIARVLDDRCDPDKQEWWEQPRGWRPQGYTVSILPTVKNKSGLLEVINGEFIITKLVSPRFYCITKNNYERKKVLSINGIHGLGAVAARQLFDYFRIINNGAEINIIKDIISVTSGAENESWQVVVRATNYNSDKKLFELFEIAYFSEMKTSFTPGSALQKFAL